MAAAVLPLITAPILGRIYLPAEYALLASYLAVVHLTSAVSTLGYQNGIVTESSLERAFGTAWISILSVAVFSIVSIPVGIVILAFGPYESNGLWFLLLPLSTAVTGISLVSMAVANRATQYRSISLMLLGSASVSTFLSIVLGLAEFAASGLMIAQIGGQLVTIGFSAVILHRNRVWASRPNVLRLRRLIIRHRGFLRFTTPATLIFSAVQHLPVLALTSLGAMSFLGSFSRARQILSLPTTVLSLPIQRIYFQRASEEYTLTGTCRPLFWRTLALLVALTLPMTLLLLVFGEELFVFYLGPNWDVAGRLASTLSVMVALQTVALPLMSSMHFKRNQRYFLLVQSLNLIAAGLACAGPWLFGAGAEALIILWMCAQSLSAVIQIGAGWKFSRHAVGLPLAPFSRNYR